MAAETTPTPLKTKEKRGVISIQVRYGDLRAAAAAAALSATWRLSVAPGVWSGTVSNNPIGHPRG